MSEGTLHVRDSRTLCDYTIPIRHNSVAASEIKKIKGNVDGSNPADKVANGLRVYDPALSNTAITEGSMTWIDGEKGVILFRGYTLEQLQDKDFEDALHLLVWEEMPSPSKRESLRYHIAAAMTAVPRSVFDVIKAFPKTAPPMTLVIAGLTAYLADQPALMPTYAGNTVYHKNVERVNRAVVETVAALGVVVAIADCHRTGTGYTPVSMDKTFYENLFTMMGRVQESNGDPDPKKLSCFRRWGNFVMDHGTTNSTFALRVTASSLTDPISCLISALAAACGSLHFGAQEAAFRTTMAVHSPENVPALIERTKRREERLHGIGHPSYKVVDPRIAPLLALFRELGTESIPHFQVAEEIDRLTSKDEYFITRRLKPNADLYNQFFYVALCLSSLAFEVLKSETLRFMLITIDVFVFRGWSPEWSPILTFVQRLPGYMAHWRKVMGEEIRLLRPVDLYVGTTEPNENRASKL